MKYVIASTAVTDEIRFADGKTVKIAGGAGIYALSGMKLWSDEVLLVTGVGQDFKDIYGEWYSKNHISMKGLIVKDEKTPHTIVQYFSNGEREETPLYGLDHYNKIEVTPEDLKPYFASAKGIYIFKNSNEAFWKEILAIKKDSKSTIMWEIGNDATYFENLSKVKEIAKQLEILSINLTEAKNLLGKEELEDIIEEFRSWQLPLIFLRRGSKGAIMITPDKVVSVPAEENVQVMDPTGGGNSSSGAVLYGYCEDYDAAACGRMGSISAAMCISQYGVPDKITMEMRQEANHKLEVK